MQSLLSYGIFRVTELSLLLLHVVLLALLEIDFFADINKLNSAVGWTPKFQIHEGVQKILEETI